MMKPNRRSIDPPDQDKGKIKGFAETTADHRPSRQNIKFTAADKKKGPALQKPVLQPKKHEAEAVSNQVPKHLLLPPEKPKKPSRVIATAEKKSPPQGANKNIITTSSWRAGGNIRSKSKINSDPSTSERSRKPDGAEAASLDHNTGDGNCNSNELAIGGGLPDFRLLAEDTRSILNDIQTGTKPTASSKETITPPQLEAQEAIRLQASDKGHEIRQALNWELHRGCSVGYKLERSRQGTQSSRHHRSEVSRRTKPTPATYKPPSQYAWVETQPDPYSVMSVSSRQSKYLADGSLQADMPNRATVTSTSTTVTSKLSKTNAAFITNLDLTSLKQPLITSSEHISVGKTVAAKTRYTRLEAGFRESDEDEAHKASHRTAASKKSHYNRQVSDAGVQTDVSQMSENEPRDVTSKTLQKLKSTPAEGRLNHSFEVHTENETNATSDMTEDIKESKSDFEMPNRRAQGDKKIMEKQQKMRLLQKYLTAREQKLHERKTHTEELLELKKKLEAQEQEFYKLAKKVIEAREGQNKKRLKEEALVKKFSKLVTPSKGEDSNVLSNRILSSIHDDAAALRSRTVQSSISEVISTQLSMSESVSDKRSRSSFLEKDKSSFQEKDKQTSLRASCSESSIPKEILSAEEQKDDYAARFKHEGSSVCKLLPQGNLPRPSPWLRKTGAESESEDSISLTETLLDVSEIETGFGQLCDELRRHKKEVDTLRKEPIQRKKHIFKANEAMKKILEQLEAEKDESDKLNMTSQRLLPNVVGATSLRKDEDISEHISASLQSILEKRGHSETRDLQDSSLITERRFYTLTQLDESDENKEMLITPAVMAQRRLPEEEVKTWLFPDLLADRDSVTVSEIGAEHGTPGFISMEEDSYIVDTSMKYIPFSTPIARYSANRKF